MRESEDHVEFKKGEQGNVSYNGGDKAKPKDRRKCILGYVTALCSQWDRRLGIVDKYNEKKIYFDDYYGRFFTGGFLNQIAMGFVDIPFPR